MTGPARCRAYFRGRGVFRYSGRRCELNGGHLATEPHSAAGRFLDPRARHVWGRIRRPGAGR